MSDASRPALTDADIENLFGEIEDSLSLTDAEISVVQRARLCFDHCVGITNPAAIPKIVELVRERIKHCRGCGSTGKESRLNQQDKIESFDCRVCTQLVAVLAKLNEKP